MYKYYLEFKPNIYEAIWKVKKFLRSQISNRVADCEDDSVRAALFIFQLQIWS